MGTKNQIRKRKPPARAAARPSRCTALVVVDSSRIRRRVLRNCELARTTFKKAETELSVYEAKDRPAFTRWYRTELGPMIEDVKSCRAAVGELQRRIQRLNRFAEMKGCGRREAARIYERSVAEFERIERALEERAAREAERQRRLFEEARQRELAELQDALARFLEVQQKLIRKYLAQGATPYDLLDDLLRLFEQQSGVDSDVCYMALREPSGAEILRAVGLEGALDDPGAEDGGPIDLDAEFEAFMRDVFGMGPDEDGPFGDRRVDPAEAATNEARITALRRELAFALHPDQSDAGDDPARLELWHQVQEAVEARDLDRLEVLHAHLQVLRGELSPGTPVSRLLALTHMYRRSRDALRRRIRALRKEAEWGFSSASPARRTELRQVCEQHLRQESDSGREQLEGLRRYYEQTFAPPPDRTKPPAAPGPTATDQLEFF